LLAAVHIATYVLAGAFGWRNSRVPGVAVIALGGALNGILRHQRRHSAGVPERAATGRHRPLGGRVHQRRRAGAPEAAVARILLGVGWGAHRSCGSVLARWPRQRLGASA